MPYCDANIDHDAQIKLLVAELERNNELLNCVLALDSAWPLLSVLEKLADAADHLMKDHSCDVHGWEEICAARDSARMILRKVNEISIGVTNNGHLKDQ